MRDSLPSKKWISSKAFPDLLDELDKFLFERENMFPLDKADYLMDLHKISITASLLE